MNSYKRWHTTSEEKGRKLILLTVILRGIIILSLVATLVNIFVNGYQYDSLFEFLPALVLVIFSFQYLFAKKGFLTVPSLVLICLLSLLAYYLSFRWGTVIPHSWILLALTVIIGGILIHARFALFLVIIHTVVTLFLTHLQNTGQLKYEWWDIKPTIGSVLVTMVILGVIALVSWLSNREIEKALNRARKSEEDLRKERDMLEVNVAEKTRQLQQVWEKERVNMQEFASIGRHTIGVIHDLVTPLTTLSLNLKMFKNINHSRLISKATQASEQIEQYIERTRNRIDNKDAQTYFFLSKEISRAKKSVAGKARSARVKITLPKTNLEAFGNPFSFYQLMLNLLDNAIDFYPPSPKDFGGDSKKREVLVDIKQNKHSVFLIVTDYGHGIALRDRKRIFDPFFTTKGSAGKMGIGLAICKEIVEKDFGGTINVKSKLNQGTTFVIKLPIVKKKV